MASLIRFELDVDTWLRNSGDAPEWMRECFKDGKMWSSATQRVEGSEQIVNFLCAGYQYGVYRCGVYDWLFDLPVAKANDGYHATDVEKLRALRAAFIAHGIDLQTKPCKFSLGRLGDCGYSLDHELHVPADQCTETPCTTPTAHHVYNAA